MSDGYYEGDDFDPYARRGGGGPAAISWKRADVGDQIVGVVVPPDPFSPTEGYDKRRSWSNDEEDRGPLVWPPSTYTLPDGTPSRRPVTESTFERWAKANGFTGKVRRKFHGEVHLLTEHRSNEFVSGPQRQRRQEEDIKDDGVRRLIDDHFDLTPKFKEALEAAGLFTGPVPGATVTIKLARREANKGAKGESNIFEVDVKPPTPETKALVDKHVAEQVAAKQSAQAAAENPYGSGSQTDEPPF